MKSIAGPAAFCAATLVFATLLQASDEADFAQSLNDLTGTWSGNLEYRDYQSDRTVQIPHQRTVSRSPDGSYLLSELSFTDPGYQVYAAELLTVNWPAVQQAYASQGGIETQRFTVTRFQKTSSGWSAQLDGSGTDSGEPAAIRLLMTLEAQHLTIEKQVRPADESAFQFRNAVRLQHRSDQGEAESTR